MFQILHRDCLARIGELEVNGKRVITPALLPVIHPFQNSPWIDIVKDLKFEGIITNSYILFRRKYEGGDIHSFLNFPGLIMTDSGTFQDYVYGGVEANNKEIVLFQSKINSDIITIRDVFSLPEDSWERVNFGIEKTYERGKEAKELIDKYFALPIQGGKFHDLRAKSARLMGSLNNEYFPIGGIVPLMEKYEYASVVDAVLLSKINLSTNSVIHAFGAGHPMFFPILVLAGADVFDSSAYIKYARDDRILTNEGTLELKFIIEELPSSPFLDKFTAQELRSLPGDERTLLIAKHNLYISQKEIKRIREEIKQENIWNYVEYRARAHPLLLDAYRRLLTYYEYLEKFESRSKRSPVFYTGDETYLRPLIRRFTEKEALSVEGESEVRKPYSYYIGPRETVVKTPFGNINIFLDETYPMAQSVFPGEYYEMNRKYVPLDSPEWIDFLKRKANYIFKFQFGIDLFSLIKQEEIELRLSKNTGKIRNILWKGEIIFSLRAEDGLFSLTLGGAKLLHNKLEGMKHKVMVPSDISKFVLEGRNIFSRFVLDADPDIRPGDEVLIIDESGNLISFGRAILNPIEMKEFKYGIAVKNRIRSRDTQQNA